MTAATRSLLFLTPLLVPEAAALTAAEREQAAAILDHALAGRPPAMRRQLALFLAVLRWLPVLRHGAPLERLAPERQRAFLLFMESCPLALFRKGFWGVRTLCFMSYYGRPELGERLGYRPSREGNALLRT